MNVPTKEELKSDIANLYATIRWYQAGLGTIRKSHTDQEIQINQLKEHGELREADLQIIDSERHVIAGKLQRSQQANIGWKKQNGRLADTIGALRRNEQRADDAIKTNVQLTARIVALDMNRDETDVTMRLNAALGREKQETIRLERALARVCEQRDVHFSTIFALRSLVKVRDGQIADAVHAKQDAEHNRDTYLREVQGLDQANKSKQKQIGRLNAELTRQEKIDSVKKDRINTINDAIVMRNREIKGLNEKIEELAKTISNINKIARFVL